MGLVLSCVRFKSVPPDWMSSRNASCYCCQMNEYARQYKTPVLEEVGSAHVLRLRGEILSVGDGIYLEPGEFDAICFR